jgi:SAM-dependent methyltransferase
VDEGNIIDNHDVPAARAVVGRTLDHRLVCLPTIAVLVLLEPASVSWLDWYVGLVELGFRWHDPTDIGPSTRWIGSSAMVWCSWRRRAGDKKRPPASSKYPQTEAMTWRGDLPVQPVERALLGGLEATTAPVLEAGVGQGRLLAVLAESGFTNLHGFDVTVRALRAGQQCGTLKGAFVTVQDARTVAYRDESFRHVVYLQQLLSFMGDETGRRSAVLEAHRILQPNGTALFSFLSLTNRRTTTLGWLLIAYIRVLRLLLRRTKPIGDLPWLKVGGRMNWRALLDEQPHAHYFTLDEAMTLLRSAGFIDVQRTWETADRTATASSALYLTCAKGPSRPGLRM